METFIRKMTPEDIEDVQRVAKASWHDTYEGIIPIDIQDRFLRAAYSEQMLIDRMNRSYMIVAEMAGKIIGFANFSYPDEAKKSLLNAIYLYPHIQGKGIGTQLLQTGIDELDDVQSIHLHVEKANETGIQFYKAKNFEIVDKIEEDFAGHTLQTIQMVLRV